MDGGRGLYHHVSDTSGHGSHSLCGLVVAVEANQLPQMYLQTPQSHTGRYLRRDGSLVSPPLSPSGRCFFGRRSSSKFSPRPQSANAMMLYNMMLPSSGLFFFSPSRTGMVGLVRIITTSRSVPSLWVIIILLLPGGYHLYSRSPSIRCTGPFLFVLLS